MTDIQKKDNEELKNEGKKEPTIADLLEVSKKQSDEEIKNLKAELEALKSSLNEQIKEKDTNTNDKKEKSNEDKEDYKTFVANEIAKAKKEAFMDFITAEQKELIKKIPNSDSLTVDQLKVIVNLSAKSENTTNNNVDNSEKKKTSVSGLDIKDNKPKQGEMATPENVLKAAFPERYKDKK